MPPLLRSAHFWAIRDQRALLARCCGEPSRTSMGSDAGQGTRQERWAARETNRRRTAYQGALEQWQSDDNELTQMIRAARSFNGSTDVNGSTVVLKKNERVFFFLPAVSLVEVQRGPGHYTGGYSGFSFRITKGVRYNVGGSRGTYVQGAEQLKVTDEGSVTVTDQRVVFVGSR